MNAPAAFQTSMEEMLSPLRDECCIPYLDDLLCYSKSFSDHLEVIRKVLQALKRHGVKLRPEKCEMFQREVRYVGLEAVLAKTPQTCADVGDIKRVLGFLGYYRSCIQYSTRIAKPLYELLQVKRSMPPTRHRKTKGRQLSSRAPI